MRSIHCREPPSAPTQDLDFHRPSTTHALRISIIATCNNVALTLLARRFVGHVGAQDSSHCCRALTTTTASATMKMDTLDRAAGHARGRSVSLSRSLFLLRLRRGIAGPTAPGFPLARFWPPSGALTNTNKPWPPATTLPAAEAAAKHPPPHQFSLAPSLLSLSP